MDFWNQNKEVKEKKKIGAKEIQENIKNIQANMKYVQNEMNKVIQKMKDLDDENGINVGKIEAYKDLRIELQEWQNVYQELQNEMEKDYTILKKYKDSKFYIQPKDVLVIVGVTGLAIFMIALERENPKATKLASFLLKLFPIKI